MPKVKLGERIVRVRERLSMTQEELAADLGVSLRSLQAYEAGTATPRPPRRRQLLAWIEAHEQEVAA